VNLLDSMIGFFSPGWAVSRMQARATMDQINAVTGGKAGYNAGKVNRFNKHRLTAEVKEHALPVAQFDRLVADSWDMYRNNPWARKIVNSIVSKVVGKGMNPKPSVTNADGSPNVQFNDRAKRLWAHVQSGFDFRGTPGAGGQTFAGQQRLALRATILTGNLMYRLVPLDAAEQMQRGLPVARTLQLLDSSRLAESSDVPSNQIGDGNQFYRGLELDAAGRRVAYWFNAVRAGESNPAYNTAKRRPASEIGHLYIDDDVDQYLGTPWCASVLTDIRDTNDLKFNVLKSTSMAACVIGSYRKATGANRVGLNTTSENASTADGTDLTDSDGNAITRLQPAMMLNLGRDGEFNLHSPSQPNMNPEAFVQHMLRGVAAGLPGVKSSTVTGDYRNSSFSSERAADNDCWPEIEALQEWFASAFCQPIYREIIKAAILSGYFNGVVTADEFASDPARFTECHWQGPVLRSINPVQDETAASERVRAGRSSLQMECSKVAVDWRQVIADTDELYQTAEKAGIPPEVVNNYLGVDANDVIAQTNANANAQEAAVA
jgi:lambda family phage portal protein